MQQLGCVGLVDDESAGARVQGSEELLIAAEAAEYQDLRACPAGHEEPRSLQRVQPWELEPHQDDVGAKLAGHGDCIVAARHFAHHCDVGLALQQRPQAGTGEPVLVREQQLDRRARGSSAPGESEHVPGKAGGAGHRGRELHDFSLGLAIGWLMERCRVRATASSPPVTICYPGQRSHRIPAGFNEPRTRAADMWVSASQAAWACGGSGLASPVSTPAKVLGLWSARSARRSATAGTMASSASAIAHMKVW